MMSHAFDVKPISVRAMLLGIYDLSGFDCVTLDQVVGPMSLDSRTVTSGDTFVALPGSVGDGREYIDAAIKSGAGLVLAEAESVVVEKRGDTRVLSLPDLTHQLSALSARYYRLDKHLDGPQDSGQESSAVTHVGITGTNGKTTCAQWLGELIEMLGAHAATIGTLGYGLTGELQSTGMTTPDAINFQRLVGELSARGADHIVSEVSSHSLVQSRAAAVPFKLAVLTNIGRDHLDYHGTLEDYVAAKTQLMDYSSLSVAVINSDDAYAGGFIGRLADDVRLLRYSTQDVSADFYAADIQYGSEGLSFTLCTPVGQFDVQTGFWGEFNVYNLLAVAASAYGLGFDAADIAAKLPALSCVDGRMQRVDAAGDLVVLVDFAHTADALEAALVALKQHAGGQLWCVFGCGGDRDAGKRPLMAQVVEQQADRIVLTSDNPRSEQPEHIATDVMKGFERPGAVQVELDREQAIHTAINEAAAGDCILLAGKGHENYQLIGTEKIPFSDVDVACLAMQQRAETQASTTGARS